jgi:hypothetical protein
MGFGDAVIGRLPRERRRMPPHGDRGRHGYRKGIVVGTSAMLASPRARGRGFGNGQLGASRRRKPRRGHQVRSGARWLAKADSSADFYVVVDDDRARGHFGLTGDRFWDALIGRRTGAFDL